MLFSVLLVLLPTAASVLAFLVVHRRWAPRGGRLRGLPEAGEVFTTVGTGLAVLLGFVIFATFDSYENGRTASGSEAVATQQIYAMDGYFDEPLKDDLRGQTVCYARAVIYDGWPAMAHGDEGPQVQHWVDAMDTTMQAAHITNKVQIEALAHWYDVSRDRNDARRTRVGEAQPFVPPLLWLALIFLTIVVIGYQILFADRSARAFGQAVGVAAMSLMLFSALAVIWMIDRPFNDRGAMISPQRMQSVLVLLERTAPSPLPCDAHGNPS